MAVNYIAIQATSCDIERQFTQVAGNLNASDSGDEIFNKFMSLRSWNQII